MARKLTDRDVARGTRLKAIRDALGLTQSAMVDVLNRAAEALGLEPSYRYYTVSRNESGSISFDDAAIWLRCDPQRRGWEWFVFGEPATIKRAKVEAVPEVRVTRDAAGAKRRRA